MHKVTDGAVAAGLTVLVINIERIGFARRSKTDRRAVLLGMNVSRRQRKLERERAKRQRNNQTSFAAKPVHSPRSSNVTI